MLWVYRQTYAETGVKLRKRVLQTSVDLQLLEDMPENLLKHSFEQVHLALFCVSFSERNQKRPITARMKASYPAA